MKEERKERRNWGRKKGREEGNAKFAKILFHLFPSYLIITKEGRGKIIIHFMLITKWYMWILGNVYLHLNSWECLLTPDILEFYCQWFCLIFVSNLKYLKRELCICRGPTVPLIKRDLYSINIYILHYRAQKQLRVPVAFPLKHTQQNNCGSFPTSHYLLYQISGRMSIPQRHRMCILFVSDNVWLCMMEVLQIKSKIVS